MINFNFPDDWRERYRVRIGFFIGLIILWRMQPRNVVLLGIGIAIGWVGIGLRQWAAGCVKKMEEVAVQGPYSLVRHPLYAGSFLAALGIVIANTSFAVSLRKPFFDRSLLFWALLWILLDSIYLPKILDEERKLTEKFGAAYTEFCARTPRLFPRAWNWQALKDGGFSWEQWKHNKEYASIVGYLVLTVVMIARYVYR